MPLTQFRSRGPLAPSSQGPLANRKGLTYLFDDGAIGTTATGTVQDRSGAKRNGTLTNSPTWTTSPYGPALQIDGTARYVATTYTGPIGNVISYEALVRLDGSTASLRAVFRTGGTNYNALYSASNGWRFSSASGTVIPSTTQPAIVLGAWYHLVAVCVGTTVTIYVNGASYGTATITAASFTDLRVGADAFGQNFSGLIALFRMYDGRALSASEVRVLASDPFTPERHKRSIIPFATALSTSGTTSPAALLMSF